MEQARCRNDQKWNQLDNRRSVLKKPGKPGREHIHEVQTCQQAKTHETLKLQRGIDVKENTKVNARNPGQHNGDGGQIDKGLKPAVGRARHGVYKNPGISEYPAGLVGPGGQLRHRQASKNNADGRKAEDDYTQNDIAAGGN